VRFSGTESGQRGIEDVLRELRDELYAVDAADTVAVLDAAWRGFSAANVAGQLLADSDPAFAALSDTTQPVFAQAGQILRAAPSLPAVIDPVMLNVACPTGDRFQQRRAQVIGAQHVARRRRAAYAQPGRPCGLPGRHPVVEWAGGTAVSTRVSTCGRRPAAGTRIRARG
jgi:hypothetical protein